MFPNLSLSALQAAMSQGGYPNALQGLLGQRMGMQPQFPQYGGDTQTGQMMNQYFSGLLAPRQAYMPPQRQRRQLAQQAPVMSYDRGLLDVTDPFAGQGE